MKKLTLGISAVALAICGATWAAETGAPRYSDAGGIITRAEAQAKAEEMFAKLDYNHDGKLDAADAQVRRSAAFDEMDANHDGQISRNEFMAYRPHRSGGKSHGDGRDMRGLAMNGMIMMRMADANHDGAVSHDEFIAAVLARFDRADTNHDGKLTPEEREAAHAAMHAHMPGHGRGHGHRAGMEPPPPAN